MNLCRRFCQERLPVLPLATPSSLIPFHRLEAWQPDRIPFFLQPPLTHLASPSTAARCCPVVAMKSRISRSSCLVYSLAVYRASLAVASVTDILALWLAAAVQAGGVEGRPVVGRVARVASPRVADISQSTSVPASCWAKGVISRKPSGTRTFSSFRFVTFPASLVARSARASRYLEVEEEEAGEEEEGVEDEEGG